MKRITNILDIVKNKAINITGIIFISSIIIGFFLMIIFLGSIVLKIFGVKYESILDLILFLGVFFIIDFPVGFVKSNLPKVLNNFKIISKSSSIILQCILSILITINIILLLDKLFTRLYLPIQSIIAFSIFITVLDFWSEKNKYY